MPVKELITVPDDILRRKSEPLNKVDVNEKKLIKDLFETMYHHNGIGLAAVQVGILKRVVVLDVSKNENDKKPLCFINPQIKTLSEKMSTYEEGCLSIPGMQGLVRRFKKIKYSGFDLDGKEIENEVEGLHARVVQHEVDHLNGILYTSRLAHKNAFGFEKEITTYWKNEQNRK